MKRKILLQLVAICLVGSFVSCNNDDDLSTAVNVLTEEVVTSSGERVIISGRVLSLAEVDIQDHGFEISTSENFTAPLLISLGAKTLPGRFIGELDGLEIRTQYYCRAFIKQGETIDYGEVLPFSTLSPLAIDFHPKFGTEGMSITVEGSNLSEDTKVLWGQQLITPDEISFESFLKFKVPPIQDMNFPVISLITQGDTLTFEDSFEYIVGLWIEEKQYTEDTGRSRHFYFRQGDKFVFGLGLAAGGTENLNKVNEVDLITLDTTKLIFPGTPVEGAFFTEGFVGGGSPVPVKSFDLTISATDAFWKYENQTFTPLANAPEKLYKAALMRNGDFLYLYGGELSDRNDNRNIYQYSIATDTWTDMGIGPASPRNSLPNYQLNDDNYFITADSIIYSHNVTTDQWQIRGEYEFQIVEYGLSLNLNGTIFVGMHDNSTKMYQYDESDNRWIPKTGLLETNLHTTSSGFVYNDEIFVIRNREFDGLDRTLWRLQPDAF